jgi:putative heme degradation protein
MASKGRPSGLKHLFQQGGFIGPLLHETNKNDYTHERKKKTTEITKKNNASLSFLPDFDLDLFHDLIYTAYTTA